MGRREDAKRHLAIIDSLLRRQGRADMTDVARAAGLSFGRTCAIVSRLGRDQLVRHIPHFGIYMTRQGRVALHQ